MCLFQPLYIFRGKFKYLLVSPLQLDIYLKALFFRWWLFVISLQNRSFKCFLFLLCFGPLPLDFRGNKRNGFYLFDFVTFGGPHLFLSLLDISF